MLNKHGMRIVLRRTGAFGDVLEATPIVARLRDEFPDAEIDFATQYPAVFKNHPARVGTDPRGNYDRFIDLDGTFERLLRKVHPVDAYS